MQLEWFRDHCLSFPHATEQVQWVKDLVFKVGGKMFAVAALDPAAHVFSFKCTPETYGELLEAPGIVPAPYMARAQWVAFERPDVLPRAEIKGLVRHSYDLVFTKLPKKTLVKLRST